MSFVPTDEQAAVIQHPLAPLRVAAGAGTGKTATLAARIVHLVGSGSVEPEQVLGITFTNKAAEELADRIRTALGGSVQPGREVEVATYHGFAHRILQEFGALVGVEREAAVITPPFARQLFHEGLGSRDWETLDLTWPPTVIDRVAALGADLGDNLLDAGALAAAAPPEADEVWRHRLELAEVLAGYEDRKRRLGMVDYADLILLAHRLLESHPEVAARLRSRYAAVLLDEYQDTNPAQRQLLLSLFGDAFPVTAVGDPHQTIYEWRGASLENFAGFPEHFLTGAGSPAPTLALRTNRRSGGLVLDLANRVREQIEAEGERLVPVEGAGRGWVGVRWLRTAAEEAGWIAAELRRLHDEEGVPWSGMAVLFRKTKDIELVRDGLEAEEIPVEVASLGGLLLVPEVADLHAWLRLLGDPEDASALVRILVGGAHRLGLADLLPLADWVRSRSRLDDLDEEHERVPSHTLLEAADDLEALEGLSDEAAARLGAFRETYRDLLREAQEVSLVELCRRILDRTGAWPEVEAMPGAARLSARLNLYRFLDVAEDWSPLEGRPSLPAFLDYLALLGEERGEELDSARLSGQDAVALLTVHRAKGLEWDTVVLPALYAGNFPAAPLGLADPDRRAEVLPGELRLDADRGGAGPDDPDERRRLLQRRHEDQEWRTAYVAVTRAKERLYLAGSYWSGQRQPWEPSALHRLAAGLPGVTPLGHEDDPGEAPDVLKLQVGGEGAPDPLFDRGWEEALREAVSDPGAPARLAETLGLSEAYASTRDELEQMLLALPPVPVVEPEPEPLRLSVTGLVTYAGCPRRYFWSEVDRLPRRPSPGARRGVEVHRRIELHNRGAAALETVEEAVYDVTGSEGAGTGATDSFETFRSSRFAVERPLLVEAPFDLKVGEARVRGRIDAVYEPRPGHWEVVDFKTGRRSSDPAARVQLQAYAVAALEAGLTERPLDSVVVTFAHLGGGLEEVSETVDEEWVAAARRRLGELVEAVQAERYEPAPSQACHHCDFVRFCPPGASWVEAHPERRALG